MAWAGDGAASTQRFEYKYLIREPQADLVRVFASSYLAPDGHTDASRGNQYLVHSLYLDSVDMGLYQSSATGEKNRFKLRVRWYDDTPHSPAFLEIKRRKYEVIQKQRAPVRKDCIDRILWSFCAVPEDLAEPSPVSVAALDRFCELCAKLTARPKAFVHYIREAYVDPAGDMVRVTMDRRLACLRVGDADGPIMTDQEMIQAPDASFGFAQGGPAWVGMDDGWVVLEIKFTDRFPRWAGEMVRALELTRRSVSKYVRAIDALDGVGAGFSEGKGPVGRGPKGAGEAWTGPGTFSTR